jgi:predicted 3-demethylubiquinone-9 3-methyltransferase (glyoxalase superfamily)
MQIEQHNKQKITPFLWFDNQAEEAVNFYTSAFKNATITGMSRYGAEGPGPAGTVMVATFEIEGQQFMALNGGPLYKFTPAVSFVVSCDTQEEIDSLWEKLAGDGGQEIQCGWLTDKYGLSWQIVPSVFGSMMQDKDAAKKKRVMQAMMQMKKMDIQKLEEAYNGELAAV